MDSNNIIEPSTNMVDLVTDYTNWCCLPYTQRKISNGVCYAKYGCNVPELYVKYKNAIKMAQDEENIEPNNLVTVSEGYDVEANEKELIEISKNLSLSPFIVIIDPSMTTQEELNDALNSFSLLSHKNRRLSNDYSWQLWGYSVPEMYNIVTAKLLDTEPEVKDVHPLDNYANYVLFNNDIVSEANISAPNNTTTPWKVKESNEFVPFRSTPWFAYKNYSYYNENTLFEDVVGKHKSDYYAYVKTLKEAYDKDPSEMNKNAILAAGWNPSVPVNEKTVSFAKEYFTEQLEDEIVTVYDISKAKVEEEDEVKPLINLKPIYLLFEHDKPPVEGYMNIKYTIVGISFDNKFYYCYDFGEKFNGFTVKKLDDFVYGTIAIALVTDNIFNQLVRVFSKGIDDDTEINIDNIFNFALNNITITHDPAKKNILYTAVLHSIMKIANEYGKKYQIKNTWLDSDTNKNLNIYDLDLKIYEVYTGYLNNKYDIQKSINDKIEFLANNIGTILNKYQIQQESIFICKDK